MFVYVSVYVGLCLSALFVKDRRILLCTKVLFIILNFKVKEHRYQTRAEFEADVELMASNCEQFNGPHSTLTMTARRLVEVCNDQTTLLFQDLYVCLFITTASLTKTDVPIKMPFGIWTRVRPKNHVLVGSMERDIPADCKYREYQACGRYFQLSLVGDHSSAGFRCQYCNNFVHLCAVNYVGELVICPVYGN